MIKLKDLLHGHDYRTLTPEQKINIKILLERLLKLQGLYKKSMPVNSGVRTRADQIRVYAEKGITDLSKIPFSSCHLKAAAADIQDTNFELTNFCKANSCQALKECELWAEDDMSVKRLHLQIFAPFSKKLFFKP